MKVTYIKLRLSVPNNKVVLVSKAISGVAPIGWTSQATIVIDEALNDYEVIWAASGHPHAVFPTSHAELFRATGATSIVVGE
jgi:prolyl-tRNA editing enzyme YbaK/EbsC (Cys-tRNA(Pro) deacylase)